MVKVMPETLIGFLPSLTSAIWRRYESPGFTAAGFIANSRRPWKSDDVTLTSAESKPDMPPPFEDFSDVTTVRPGTKARWAEAAALLADSAADRPEVAWPLPG